MRSGPSCGRSGGTIFPTGPCAGLLVSGPGLPAGNLVGGGSAVGAELDAADHLVLGTLVAGFCFRLFVDEAAGDCNLPALLEMLGAGFGALAERRDVDEHRRRVALVVDREAQVTDGLTVLQGPCLGVLGELTD